MQPSKLQRVVSIRTDLDDEPKNGLKPLRKRRAMPANGNAIAVAEEPESIQRARARIRDLISQAADGEPPASIGIVLAIVTQETGHHAAANALIDEYQLDTLFGIKKFA